MNSNQTPHTLATPGSRLLAAFIDYLIYSFTIGILLLMIWPFTGYENLYQSLLDYTIEGTVSETYITYSLLSIGAGLVSGLIYYALIPTKTKGQTLGKKMFHIKAVKVDGTQPSFITHLIRAVMLYGVFINAILLFVLLFNKYSFYDSITTPFGFITTFVLFVSFIMILARSDHRGLHDLIGGTYVVFEGAGVDRDSEEPSKKEDPFLFNYDTLDNE